ncbi:MAG: hypothetical protein AAFX02_00340 [Pseudomonadota bacterium]
MKRTLTRLAALAFLASLANAFASADEMTTTAPASAAATTATSDWYAGSTFSAATLNADLIRIDPVQGPFAPAAVTNQAVAGPLFPSGFNRDVLQLRQSFSLSVDNGQLKLGDRRAGQRPLQIDGFYSSRSSFVDNPSNTFDANHPLFQ